LTIATKAARSQGMAVSVGLGADKVETTACNVGAGGLVGFGVFVAFCKCCVGGNWSVGRKVGFAALAGAGASTPGNEQLIMISRMKDRTVNKRGVFFITNLNLK
jgi:hypothetical protein